MSAHTCEHHVETVVDLLSRPMLPEPRTHVIDGVVIGRLVILHEGEALVEYPGSPTDAPQPARVAAPISHDHVGREVVLAFEQGDARRPIVIGAMWEPPPAPMDLELATGKCSDACTCETDGERVTLSAEKELVLQCGKASITLTRAGKVLIRGAYVLSRSSGANRIKGGSVQIN